MTRRLAGASLALSTLAVLAADWTVPPEDAARPNPRSPTSGSLQRGRDLYMETCALCHAEGGEGDDEMSESLGVPVGDLTDSPALSSRTDGELHWKIRKGSEEMPAFEEIFSDDEIWDIVNHVRSLAGGTEDAAGVPR